MIAVSKEKLTKLKERLGMNDLPDALLCQAVTHSSATTEVPSLQNYERLEFLGDAVLQMVVTRHLYDIYTTKQEGWMTWMRQMLVSEEALSTIGRELDMPKYTILGAGSLREGTANLDSVIADQVEAILAVIYLQHGLKQADAFIWPFLSSMMKKHEKEGDMRDPKSHLQEILQKNGTVQIIYQLLSREGKPPQEVFVSSVMLNGKQLAVGQGKSKKAAEKEAAKAALQTILKERY